MGKAACRIMNLLGLSDAENIIEGLDKDGAAGLIAKQTISQLDQASRQGIVQVVIANAIDRIEERQERANGAFVALKQSHDDTMSGRTPGCRSMEVMQKKAWRFLAVSILVPIIVAAIVFMLTRS